MEKDYGYLFNIIMIGYSGVGKTSILMQYKDGKFAFTGTLTAGIDFYIKTHEIDGNVVKVRPLPPSLSSLSLSVLYHLSSIYLRTDAIIYILGRQE